MILASSGVNLSGEDSVVMASENIKGTARELIALSAEDATSSADRALLIGPNIEVRNTGVLAFNAKKREKLTSQKDHSVLINADRGLIINANSTPDNVLLKVNGGVKLAHDAALDTT